MFGLVRLFLPTGATGGVKDLFCICFQGPGGVGVGFTNLGKSHHRTPGFWIGKYQALRREIDYFMNTFFVR